MAASSSSSTVASSRANYCSYDVFLSFRGEDTRNSFTDHLYEALVRAGFRTFRDNDAIDRGEDLKPEIARAITLSRASIVVLSENYANSTWCLDELLLILEQRKNSNHLVLPVFYHVDPSDVRKQQQSFADAFSMRVKDGVGGSQTSAKWMEKAERWKVALTDVANLIGMVLSGKQQKSFADAFSMRVKAGVGGSHTSVKWMEKADMWKVALTDVANLTGMVLSGPETNFIADIVNTIGHKLNRKVVSTPAHLTGMDTRSKDINSWLKIKQSDAEVLAICGMGGSGKTTLAKYIYNSNSRKFENSSFLEDIKKSCEQPHGLLELQKQLLTDILGNKKREIFNVSEGTSMIEEALQIKKVLIVLDDIDKGDELAALLGTQKFNTENKIIITTRDLETHAWFETTSRKCRKYTLKLLNDNESLKLLSWHAFGSEIPMEGFKELAVQVAQYCAGNPLALKVLGSSLFVSEDLRKGNNIESWRSTLKLLTKDTHSGIQGILRRSFDSLPYVSCKELFLHIASFFIGVDKDYVVKILETDYSASAGIITLVNRSLLTVSPSNKLMMHQLLQEMGRTIIREESPKDPARRSRVWCNQESYAILKKGKGSKTIEGLSLDMRRLEKQEKLKSSALTTDSFTKMENLKLLQLKYVQFTGSYDNFPEYLTWLCWHGFNLRTAPLDLFMGNLVAIDMSYSNLEQFELPMILNSLKILNLKDSQKLVEIHNIFRLPNLETLILWNCSSLADVCETIGDLENLILLDMTGCENLWKVFVEAKHINPLEGLKASDFGRKCPKPLFSLPHSLKKLLLNNCNLELTDYFRMEFSAISCLQYLNVGNNPFDLLPNYNNLKNLRVLDLTFCQRLKFLLCLPNTLEELYIYYCVSLEKITFQSAQFRLREIGYGGCLNLTEIQGLFNLVPIERLDEADLGHMKWLKAYQSHEVGLIGDEITEGRSSRIQILYEFGIMSTFLPDVKDPNMVPENMSRSPFLSFLVPSCPKGRRLQGLNVTFVYRLSGEESHVWPLFAKISNITTDQNWIYNPIVFGKPEVDKNTVWLSYWAIGNILDIGDEVNVSIVVGNEVEVSECGASLVYIDDVEKEILQNNIEREEVLGGDLSAFQLSTGGYYLCRRDFFESKEIDETTPDWFKILVGDTVDYTEVQGWSKFGRCRQLKASFTEVETYRCITHIPELDETYNKQTVDVSTASAKGKSVESTISVPKETMKSAIISESSVSTATKVVLKVNIDSQRDKKKVMKAVSKCKGIDSIAVDTKVGTLIVVGDVDPTKMVAAVRKTGHFVEILTIVPANPSPPSKKPSRSIHLNMRQVARATQNFSRSHRLGEGGFGTVYKAQLQDGQVVAIKRAKKEHFDALRSEFRSEVELLAKIEHRNLVKLLGYVDEGNERLIITEYVPNGTLREHLDGVHGSFLNFSQRLEISIDIAHGLTYLHLYAEKQIIHRDVKSSNILLTERMRAKVADFGFARLGDTESDKTHVLTKVRGTVGYLDPEYMRTYQLTPKSDVYSFGVLLIEILTGRRPIESRRSPDEKVTIRWAFAKYNEGEWADLVDPQLKEAIDGEIFEKMLGLAFQCAAPTRTDRPDIKLVGEQLWSIRMNYLRHGRSE